MLVKLKLFCGKMWEVSSDKEIPDALLERIRTVEGVAEAKRSDRYKLYYYFGECFKGKTVAQNVEAAIREFYMDGCPFYMPCRIRFTHES